VKSAFPKDGFFLRAESFYNLAANLDELDEIRTVSPELRFSYGGKSLHKQSHGESFLVLVLNRFGGKGLYLLDEPEAALSPARQLTLIAQISQLIKNDSQFLIATHSPILMAYPDAEILLLDETGVHSIAYEETEHYQITKEFLNHPERMLRELLD
jgi:predicted ATPase